MYSLKEIVCVYYLGLSSGYFEKEDVINWADNYIENNDVEEIPYKMFEISLSLSESTVDLASMLKEIFIGDFSGKPLMVILGFCYKDLKDNLKTYDEIFNIIYKLSLQSSYCNNNYELTKLNYLSQEYYLAKQQIYGNLKEIKDKTLSFLEEYEKYAKVNYLE
ncbi:hypothetical protein BX659_11011 [Orenia metallireducens]|uniref:Uncharacterized protein n=1 Tax=Orenia metallireducens TaxID=1413210 RepID=A0A285HY47_9FIRM|nr:hypothetical protein [Orenia metallireducens]PRX29268.1 hypothetical protein BX659_11011 [Orenia metallireducens]SNY40563.1 hypothetical protein SAMN06265827_12711 [Orenia metallireducens]